MTPVRVLLLEDDPNDVALILRALSRGGLPFEVQAIAKREEFEAALRQPTWDLVLCDYHLPDFDARAVLAGLRERGIATPFIVVSGFADQATALDLVHSGADDFVHKDALAWLVPAVQRAVRGGEERRALGAAERSVHENEARLRAIVDAALDGIVVIDGDSRIETFNPMAEQIFGYRSTEVLGQRVEMLMPASLVDEHGQSMRRVVAGGRPNIIGIRREVLARRKDGHEFPLELTVSEFWVGGARRFMGMVRDLTDRKRLEEQLRQSQKMDAIGRLAGGVAHDFNNLLTAIVTCAHLAREETEEGSSVREDLDRIAQAAERGGALTRQLLAFARIQSGEPRVVDLVELIDRLAGLVSRVVTEKVRLFTQHAPTVHPVLADPAQIEQVLLNLAVNARDSMPAGGTLVIETRVIEIERDSGLAFPGVMAGPAVQVTVADTGTGMSSETMARLFEPFFTTKPAGAGTGLGLATCYGIVKQLGGHIWAESEPGEGSRFHFVLPQATDSMAKQAAEPALLVAGGAERILVVEDDPMVREVSVQVLRGRGYRVDACPDGVAALAYAREQEAPIDLLVSDVVMPGFTGPQVAAALLDRFPTMRVLLMTGYSSDQAALKEPRERFELLRKPFTPQDLVSRVRSILDQNSGT